MLEISVSLVTLMFTIAFSLDTAPVIIQDEGLLDGAVNTQNKVMGKMSKEEFELVVDAASKLGECLIFFIEDSLSMQDMHTKDERGTPYVHFTEAFMNKKSKFFPRVVEPYNYLKNRFQAFDFNTFYVTSTSTRLRLEESFKFIYVFFEDSANETRTQRLRRHDAIMQEVFFVVKQLAKGPVVSFYTGKIVRDKVQDIPARTQQPLTTRSLLDHLVVKCSHLAFEFDAEMIHDDDIPSYLKVDECKLITEKHNHWTYKITLEHIMEHEQPVVYELRFIFTPLKGLSGWKLLEVEYLSPEKEKLTTVSLNITNAWKVIYKSKHPLILKPDDKFGNMPTLHIEKYTIQFFLPKSNLRTEVAQEERYKQKQPVTTVKEDDVTEEPPEEKPPVLKHKKDRKEKKQHPNQHQLLHDIDLPPVTFLKTEDFPEVFLSDVLATCFFIVFIMLMILTFGVVMIMGVCTNSIYDNVEQKALFIPEGSD